MQGQPLYNMGCLLWVIWRHWRLPCPEIFRVHCIETGPWGGRIIDKWHSARNYLSEKPIVCGICTMCYISVHCPAKISNGSPLCTSSLIVRSQTIGTAKHTWSWERSGTRWRNAVMIFSIWCAEWFSENTKPYLQFLFVLSTEMMQVVQILPGSLNPYMWKLGPFSLMGGI